MRIFFGPDLTSLVIGAAIEVHRVLGPGFLESVYEHALCIELESRNVPFRRQVPIVLQYKAQLVGRSQLDLLVADRLIVELKAVEALAPVLFRTQKTHLISASLRLCDQSRTFTGARHIRALGTG